MFVVRSHYNARLAVMNMGDGFTAGPAEAAYVISELVKPASVIASQGAGARPALGKDDGVRRERQVQRRMLSGLEFKDEPAALVTAFRSPKSH